MAGRRRARRGRYGEHGRRDENTTCGVIAGPLFVVTFLAEGATRAAYDPLRHPVSSLALGEHGWMQTADFLVAGLLTLAFAVGMWHVLRTSRCSIRGPLLVGVCGDRTHRRGDLPHGSRRRIPSRNP